MSTIWNQTYEEDGEGEWLIDVKEGSSLDEIYVMDGDEIEERLDIDDLDEDLDYIREIVPEDLYMDFQGGYMSKII